MVKSTEGVGLMQQINSGELQNRRSKIAEGVREHVSEAMDELITVGARVRPLMLGGKRVGWFRPFSYSERKILDRHITDSHEQSFLLLKHCTTLTESEIEDLDIYELNSVLSLIHTSNLADYSLYPYISPFSYTQTSIGLWNTRHDELFSRREIVAPDGQVLKLLTTPIHITLWTNLCTSRERSLAKLETTLDFASLIKAQVGKSADKYVNDIVKAINSFSSDSIEPWMDVIDFVKAQATDSVGFNDGFGHSHQDSSVQGLMREMQGMMEGDNHEKLMDTFYETQMSAAKKKEEAVQKIIAERREAMTSLDDGGAMVVLTEREVKERERQLRQASPQVALQRQLAEELGSQIDSDEVDPSRISKYFSNS